MKDQEIARLTAELSQLKAHQLPAVVSNASDVSVLRQIDNNIGAATPVEAAQWVQIKGAVIEQDQQIAERQHHRSGEMLALKARIGMSIGAMGIGAALVIGHVTFPGLFCLGAALYTIAPDYVMMMAKNFRPGGGDE